MRVCNECGEVITNEGFVVDEGLEYYCSQACLHKNYDPETCEEMYEAGWIYWTEFEE